MVCRAHACIDALTWAAKSGSYPAKSRAAGDWRRFAHRAACTNHIQNLWLSLTSTCNEDTHTHTHTRAREVLKVDAEGHEPLVLTGADCVQNPFSNNIETIVFKPCLGLYLYRRFHARSVSQCVRR